MSFTDFQAHGIKVTPEEEEQLQGLSEDRHQRDAEIHGTWVMGWGDECLSGACIKPTKISPARE